MKRGPKRVTPAERAAADAARARDGGCVHLTPGRCDRSADPHHVWRNGQGGPWATWNLVTVCRTSHSWIHDHPLVSGSLGLLVPSWTERSGAEAAAELRDLYRYGQPFLAPWLTDDEIEQTIRQAPEFAGAILLPGWREPAQEKPADRPGHPYRPQPGE